MHSREFWQLYEAGERNFRGVDLSGAKIEGQHIEIHDVNLSDANLERAEISQCYFYNSNFTATNFQSSFFYEVSFNNSNLAETNFKEMMTADLNFTGCDMRNAILTDAQLNDVYFNGTNLSYSVWRGSIWHGGLKLSDLTQADLNGLIIDCVELAETILPNGTSVNHIWENIVIKGKPPEPGYPQLAQLDNLVELRSEVGIDYSILRDFLAAKRWIDADRETARLVCKASGHTFPDVIEVTEIVDFPCIDLKTIDQLWVQSSWDRFGFSIQHSIWCSITNEYEHYESPNKMYERFHSQLGWRQNKSFLVVDTYKDKESIEKAVRGFMPLIGMWAYLYGTFFFGGDETCLYERISSCRIIEWR
jgi:hypothetical protein